MPGNAALTARFDGVCERLARAVEKAGNPVVQLIAVSKMHEASSVAQLATHWAEHGPGKQPVFGENYVQEVLAKQEEVASLLASSQVQPQWHFIGHVQSRKAKEIVNHFSLIHTVDSEKLAGAFQKAWLATQQEQSRPQPVLIQVNIGREEQKGGVLPEGLEALATHILAMPELELQGLMCLPPYDPSAEFSRPFFQEMRTLREQMATQLGHSLPVLSMGMSHDFEVAIEEGATMIRVGTDIFGQRVYT